MSIKHIVLDTESTGLGPKEHRLVEVAAAFFDPETGRAGEREFHRYINPQRDVPPEAVAVHGLTTERLAHEPVFAEVAQELLEFVGGTHVVIHNAPFDVAFLNTELRRSGKPALDAVIQGATDTLALSRRFVRSTSHTLDVLCDRYGVDRSIRDKHGALVDCHLLAAVYPALVAEANQVKARINGALPFDLDAELPTDLSTAAQRYLHLAELAKFIGAEQERYAEYVRKAAAGENVDGSFYEVEFKPRVTTDWEKVKAKYLEGIDLQPFRKASSAMNIRYK